MPEPCKVASQARRTISAAASILFASLFFAGGCKTSDDATAVASQLTETAKCLRDYYTALDTMLSETDQLYVVQAVVNPVTPYDDQTKAYVADLRAEIQKRETFAGDLTTLAEEFSSLSNSKAPGEMVESAGKMESEIDAMELTKTGLSTGELNMMNVALGAIVKAIQEHKEREAAKQMDAFASNLSGWFVRQEPQCESIGRDYARVSKSLALTLLEKGQTDPSNFLKVALDPYGLTPDLTDPALKLKVKALAKEQVGQKADALEAAQKSATEAMEKSLKEMSKRIDLLANEKPMALRSAPISIADVEEWASQFTATSSATSK